MKTYLIVLKNIALVLVVLFTVVVISNITIGTREQQSWNFSLESLVIRNTYLGFLNALFLFAYTFVVSRWFSKLKYFPGRIVLILSLLILTFQYLINNTAINQFVFGLGLFSERTMNIIPVYLFMMVFTEVHIWINSRLENV